ncbi:MAG: hypothetical protein AB7Q16_22970 [Vicinamibacterales bacterium]
MRPPRLPKASDRLVVVAALVVVNLKGRQVVRIVVTQADLRVYAAR